MVRAGDVAKEIANGEQVAAAHGRKGRVEVRFSSGLTVRADPPTSALVAADMLLARGDAKARCLLNACFHAGLSPEGM